MPIKIVRYLCQHCVSDTSISEKSCLHHEARCSFNPNTKNCKTCDNFRYINSIIGFSCVIDEFRDDLHEGNCKDWELKK